MPFKKKIIVGNYLIGNERATLNQHTVIPISCM